MAYTGQINDRKAFHKCTFMIQRQTEENIMLIMFASKLAIIFFMFSYTRMVNMCILFTFCFDNFKIMLVKQASEKKRSTIRTQTGFLIILKSDIRCYSGHFLMMSYK